MFVGGVPNEETVQFYRAADLLVYPSFNETFGLPILEAMACACPVVTSNISSMPEIAGGAAILADPHDPNSIARSILEAIGSGCDQDFEPKGFVGLSNSPGAPRLRRHWTSIARLRSGDAQQVGEPGSPIAIAAHRETKSAYTSRAIWRMRFGQGNLHC